MARLQLPDPSARIVDELGRPTAEFYTWLRSVARLGLSDLSDVDFSAAPSNGDVPTYDGSAGKWKAQ